MAAKKVVLGVLRARPPVQTELDALTSRCRDHGAARRLSSRMGPSAEDGQGHFVVHNLWDEAVPWTLM